VNLPFGWKIPALMAAAVGVTVWAGRNLEIALPAAVVAVGAGVALLFEVWGIPPAARPGSVRLPENLRASVRDLFRSGRLGREMVVELLDRLERNGPNPSLPGTTADEFERVVHLSRIEFRRYVRERLDYLEARA